MEGLIFGILRYIYIYFFIFVLTSRAPESWIPSPHCYYTKFFVLVRTILLSVSSVTKQIRYHRFYGSMQRGSEHDS